MKTVLGTMGLLSALLLASSAPADTPQNQPLPPPVVGTCQCSANGAVLTAGKLPQCTGGLVATCNCSTGQPTCGDAAQKFRIKAEGVKGR